jgi:hypothetical protein
MGLVVRVLSWPTHAPEKHYTADFSSGRSRSRAALLALLAGARHAAATTVQATVIGTRAAGAGELLAQRFPGAKHAYGGIAARDAELTRVG